MCTLRWRHNGCYSVSNHQPHHCLLNRLFRRRSKKTSKLRVTGLCAKNSPGTGEFSAQMASNAENVSIWWRHHATISFMGMVVMWILSIDNNIWKMLSRWIRNKIYDPSHWCILGERKSSLLLCSTDDTNADFEHHGSMTSTVRGGYRNNKYHNSLVPYPTIHHSEQKYSHFCSVCEIRNKYVPISGMDWWDTGQGHCGICEIDLLWIINVYGTKYNIVANLQTTFSNKFVSLKIVIYWFGFHWSLFSEESLGYLTGSCILGVASGTNYFSQRFIHVFTYLIHWNA